MNLTYLTDSFAVSGQISPGDLSELKDQGFVAVVCNRPDHEEPGQPDAATMKAAAGKAGLQFEHIPMVGPNFTADDVESLKAVMSKGKVMAYCRTGNRSSILWKAANS